MYAPSISGKLSPSFAIRPGEDTDRNYILDTWRKSESASIAHIEGSLYSAMQTGAMAAILSRSSTTVRIAHPIGSDDTIAAWAVVRAPVPVLHKGSGRLPAIGPTPIVYYIYVREDGRRLGIGRMLLADYANRPRVLYTSRVPHVRDARGSWQPSPIQVPRSWQYCPRAAFVEAP
jgi:GNAT superfamily N-acetyltransferase